MTIYGRDWAHVYDAGFQALADAAGRELREHIHPPAHVLDIGCGGGVLSEQLVAAGYTVWGIDISPEMVAAARLRLPGAQFIVGDALEAELPSCDAIAAIGEVCNYVLAQHGFEGLGRLLERCFAALKPGGILLFDAATSEAAADGMTERSQANAWRLEAHAEAKDGWMKRTIDIWRPDAAGIERHSREVHRLRLADPEALEASLRDAGFEFEWTAALDDFLMHDGWEAIIARKPR